MQCGRRAGAFGRALGLSPSNATLAMLLPPLPPPKKNAQTFGLRAIVLTLACVQTAVVLLALGTNIQFPIRDFPAVAMILMVGA